MLANYRRKVEEVARDRAACADPGLSPRAFASLAVAVAPDRLQGSGEMATRNVELVAAASLSPTVRALTLRCMDGQPLGHVAGQWVNVDVPTGGEVIARRAYSVASSPSPRHGDRFELAVTRVDAGQGASQALHALPVGGQLAIDGPHGFFTREQERNTPALLVGTGTGVCPLLAMLEDELVQSDGPPLGLLFGCRSEQDILFRDRLEAWARDCPRFRLWVTLSRPSAGWTGWTGYVQTHLGEILPELQRPHVYVCGLTKMVSEVRRVLKEQHGYDRKLIHSERYD
jgi:ferredoxin-NADP reductase